MYELSSEVFDRAREILDHFLPIFDKSGLCLSPSTRNRIVVDFSDMDRKLEFIILCADTDCGIMGLPVLMHVGAPGAPI